MRRLRTPAEMETPPSFSCGGGCCAALQSARAPSAATALIIATTRLTGCDKVTPSIPAARKTGAEPRPASLSHPAPEKPGLHTQVAVLPPAPTLHAPRRAPPHTRPVAALRAHSSGHAAGVDTCTRVQQLPQPSSTRSTPLRLLPAQCASSCTLRALPPQGSPPASGSEKPNVVAASGPPRVLASTVQRPSEDCWYASAWPEQAAWCVREAPSRPSNERSVTTLSDDV